jgi:hypothetical protein
MKPVLELTHPHCGDLVSAIMLADKKHYALPISFRARRATTFLAYLINHLVPTKAYQGTVLPNTKGSVHVVLFTGIVASASPEDYSLIISETGDDDVIPKKRALAVSFMIETPAKASQRRLLDGNPTITYPTSNSTVCTQFLSCGSYGGNIMNLSATMTDGTNTINGGAVSGDPGTGIWTIPFADVPDEVYTFTVTDSTQSPSPTSSSNNVTVDASVCDPPPPNGGGGPGGAQPPGP